MGGRTDKPSYRDAWAHLKIVGEKMIAIGMNVDRKAKRNYVFLNFSLMPLYLSYNCPFPADERKADERRTASNWRVKRKRLRDIISCMFQFILLKRNNLHETNNNIDIGLVFYFF